MDACRSSACSWRQSLSQCCQSELGSFQTFQQPAESTPGSLSASIKIHRALWRRLNKPTSCRLLDQQSFAPDRPLYSSDKHTQPFHQCTSKLSAADPAGAQCESDITRGSMASNSSLSLSLSSNAMPNEIDVDVLITLVQEKQHLWDQSRKDYKDRNRQNEGWREILQILHPAYNEMSDKDNRIRQVHFFINASVI